MTRLADLMAGHVCSSLDPIDHEIMLRNAIADGNDDQRGEIADLEYQLQEAQRDERRAEARCEDLKREIRDLKRELRAAQETSK